MIEESSYHWARRWPEKSNEKYGWEVEELIFSTFFNSKFSTVAGSTHFGAWFLSTLREPCETEERGQQETGRLCHVISTTKKTKSKALRTTLLLVNKKWQIDAPAPKINGVDVMMSNWVVRSRPRGGQKSSGHLELTQWALQYFGKALLKIPSNQKCQHLGYKTTESVWLRQVRISHFSLFILFTLILGH